MKTSIGIVIVLLAIAMLAGTAFAQVTPTASVVLFGGANQRASNPLDDNGPQPQTATKQISFSGITGATTYTVTLGNVINTGKFQYDQSVDLGNAVAVSNALANNPDLLLIKVTEAALAVGDPSISVQVLIPASLDAIDPVTLQPGASKLADVTINLDDPNTTLSPDLTFPIEFDGQRENNLEIDDVKAEINGAKRETIDDKDKVENLKPSDVIELEAQIRSLFDDNDEVDLENTDVKLDCDEKNLDIDDDTLDFGDISPDDTDTDTFTINVDDDAEDTSISCDLFTLSTDENGAVHGQEISFTLEVERLSHDVQVDSLTLIPQVVGCSDLASTATIGLVNRGKSDEDRVSVEVNAKSMNFQQRRTIAQELNEDDSTTEAFSVPIPADLKPGFHAIEVTTYYDNKLSNTERVVLENTCKRTDDEEQPEEQPPVVFAEPLSLDRSAISAKGGDAISLSATVTNTESAAAEFVVTVDNIEDFASPVAPKTVFLQPGQSSAILFTLDVNDAATVGKYSATVNVRSASGQTQTTKSVSVDLKETQTNMPGAQLPEVDMTKVFWIVLDVILVIVAVFFIKLIFTSGRKSGPKPGQQTLGDIDAMEGKRGRR